MNINKKTYKILNLVIVVLFLGFLLTYSAILNKEDRKSTVRINKTFSIQKSVAGYLLEIEGLFFEERQKKPKYFRGASNPLTAFRPLKKDVWLDFMLSAIQSNYNERRECYFPPQISKNIINIYKIRAGNQTEISPSINIKMDYTDNLENKIDNCLTFMTELIDEVNSKIRQLIINEIQGYEYDDFIRSLKPNIAGNLTNKKIKRLDDLISVPEVEANITSEDMIPVVQALIEEEINLKKKVYKDINSFELKEKTSETYSSTLNHYMPIIFIILITIFLMFILHIAYRYKVNFPNIFK